MNQVRGTTLLEMVTWDSDFFKGIVLPPKLIPYSGDVVDEIMTRCYNLTCAWEEPPFFKQQVHRFFRTHLEEFTRLYETVIAEYNPLENYDRFEDSQDNGAYENSSGSTTSSSYKDNGKSTDTYVDTSSGSVDREYTVSADNSPSYQPDRKEGEASSNNVNHNGSGGYNNDGTGNVEGTADGRGTNVNQRTSHIHGNIGVTTSQQMLQQERELVKFNIFEYIAELFERRLMIRIY